MLVSYVFLSSFYIAVEAPTDVKELNVIPLFALVCDCVENILLVAMVRNHVDKVCILNNQEPTLQNVVVLKLSLRPTKAPTF